MHRRPRPGRHHGDHFTKRVINYSNSACPLTIEVAAGATEPPVYLTGSACFAVRQPHILGPYESDVRSYPFLGSAWQRAAALDGASEEWVDLAPGTYQVVAEMNETTLRSLPVGMDVLP